MIKLNLNENFICRIWEDTSYYSELKTTSGKKLEILDLGRKNTDGGPDYYNSKVKIDGISYSGCIEIHRSESDWHEHKHSKDNKYNEVILQVVFYMDKFTDEFSGPKVKKSRCIPTVILSEFLTKSVHEIWKEIINNPSPDFKLPCYPKNHKIENAIKTDWLKKLSIERLNDKSEKIRIRLEEISDNKSRKIFWEKVLYESVCEALGYSKNKIQFLKLSQKIEFDKISNMKLDRIQIDSLLYGLSGFLNDLRFKDDYIEELKYNWNILKSKIQKEIIDKSEWNFFRLRPVNFPTIRIAFASGLLYEIFNNNFFKNIIDIFENGGNITNDLLLYFKSIETSDYWKNHYSFGKESNSAISKIGNERIKDIMTNVLIPLVNLYSVNFNKVSLNKRVEFLYRKEKQKSGGNEITRVMEKQLDVKVNSISEEQALIQLHNIFCIKGNCNDCAIGKSVFSKSKIHDPLKIILY